jgi:hypothetical protein
MVPAHFVFQLSIGDTQMAKAKTYNVRIVRRGKKLHLVSADKVLRESKGVAETRPASKRECELLAYELLTSLETVYG